MAETLYTPGCSMRVSTVRLSEDHWKLLKREAMREGLSAAQFIRDDTMVPTAYATGQRGDEAFEEALARVRPRPDADPPKPGAQRRQALLDTSAVNNASSPWTEKRSIQSSPSSA